MSAVVATKFSSNRQIEEGEEDSDCDDPAEEGCATIEIGPDQLWAMPLSIKSTPSPKLHKFISFLSSIFAAVRMSRVFFHL